MLNASNNNAGTQINDIYVNEADDSVYTGGVPNWFFRCSLRNVLLILDDIVLNKGKMNTELKPWSALIWLAECDHVHLKNQINYLRMNRISLA